MTSIGGRAARTLLRTLFLALFAAGVAVLATLFVHRGRAFADGPSAATTCTTTWTGAKSQDWLTAANWSARKVPTGADWVCIPTGVRNLPVVISSTVNISGMTNAGGLTMVGALNLASKTATSTSTGPLVSNGPFAVAHALAVSGRFLSTGGTLSGAGAVTIERGATWTVKSGAALATTVVNDGAVVVPANGVFVIATGGRLDNVASTSVLPGGGVYGSCSGRATTGGVLVNAGVLNFEPGTGNVSNLGGLEPAEPCLDVQNEKTLQISSGTAIVKQSAVLELDKGSSVTGAGELELAGVTGRAGSLKVNAGSTVPNLQVAGGAFVTGASNLTVSGSLTTAGGTLAGSGYLIVAPKAKWTATGGTLFMQMVNEGAATIPPGGKFLLETTSNLTNTGSITLDDAAGLYGLCKESATSGGVLTNKGLLEFNPGVGSSAYLGDVETGENCLDVRDTGNIAIAAGSAVLYQNASVDLNAGSTVTGTGVLAVGSGTGNSGVGVLNVNATSTVASLALGPPGVVQGPAALTVTGTLNSAGGTFAGPGDVTVGAKANWIAGAATIATKFNNAGAAKVPAAGSIVVATNGVLDNTGSISIIGAGGGIYGSCTGAASTGGEVISGGQLSFAPGTGNQAFLGDLETEEACLDVQDSGPITISSGFAVVYEFAALDLETATTVAGPGTLSVGSANSPNGPGTLNVLAPSSVALLTVTSGTVTAAANLDVTGSLLTSGGTLDGSGTVTVGGPWTASGGKIATNLVNSGTASVAANASVEITRDGNVDNLATASMNLQASAQLVVDGFGQLTNDGSLTLGDMASIDGQCTGTPPTTPGTFTNTGTLAFAPAKGDAAYLGSLNDAGACLDAVDSGTVTVSADGSAVVWAQATLTLAGGSPKVQGPGKLVVGSTGFGAGTLVVNSAATVDDLEVSTGTIEGSQTLTVNHSMQTDATSDIGASPSDTSGSGALLTLAPNSAWTVDGGTINPATTVTIDSGATATIQADDFLTISTSAAIVNAGILTMLGGTAIEGYCIGGPSGGVIQNTGALVFDPGLNKFAFLDDAVEPDDPCLDVQDSGTVNLKSGETIVYNQASLDLESTLANPVTGSGALVVGDGSAGAGVPPYPGTLNVDQNATLAGSLELDGGQVNLAAGVTLTTSNLIAAAGIVDTEGSSTQPWGLISVSSAPTGLSLAALDINLTLGSWTPTCPGSTTNEVAAVSVAPGGTITEGFNPDPQMIAANPRPGPGQSWAAWLEPDGSAAGAEMTC